MAKICLFIFDGLRHFPIANEISLLKCYRKINGKIRCLNIEIRNVTVVVAAWKHGFSSTATF